MNILQLQYFCDLVKTQNVSQSAKNLFVSQPAVSNMLKKLENELGFELFDRRGKSIILNENGRQFYKAANTIFDVISRNQRNNLYSEYTIVEEITLGFRASEMFFSPLLKEYQELYPNSLFRIMSNQKTINLEARSSLDFFIVRKFSQFNHMYYLTLPYQLPCDYYLLLPAGHPLCQEPYITYRQFCEPLCQELSFVVVASNFKSTPPAFSKLNEFGAMPKIKVITDDRFIMLSLVAHNNMASIVPYVDAIYIPPSDSISLIPLCSHDNGPQNATDNYYFCWSNNDALSIPASTFKNFIMEKFHLTEKDIHYKEL